MQILCVCVYLSVCLSVRVHSHVVWIGWMKLKSLSDWLLREFKSATGFNWTDKAVLPGSLSILCVFVCVCARDY